MKSSHSDALNKFATEQFNEVIADCVLRIPVEQDAEKRQLLIETSNKLIDVVEQLVEPTSSGVILKV